MTPVSTIVLPDNGRLKFDPEASEEILGSFVTLPIVMPRNVTVWTGSDGRPVVMWADDQRIKPADFAVVWRGIEQYNSDCESRGAVYEDVVIAEELGDGGVDED